MNRIDFDTHDARRRNDGWWNARMTCTQLSLRLASQCDDGHNAFWGTLAMGLTAGVGAPFGTVA